MFSSVQVITILQLIFVASLLATFLLAVTSLVVISNKLKDLKKWLSSQY